MYLLRYTKLLASTVNATQVRGVDVESEISLVFYILFGVSQILKMSF